MRRTSIIATAIGGLLVSSSAFAGFTVNATLGSTAGGFDRWDVVAINTGGDTGVQVKGLEYNYSGSPAAFQVDDADENGTPDTVNLLSTNRTRIRVASSTNTYVGLVPPGLGVEPNPYISPLGAFSGAIANTGTTNASGTGFQIARIYLPTGGSGVLSGNIGGDIGNKVPFSVNLGGTINANPVIAPVADTSVVFGAIVTSGAPFSVNVTVTDTNAADILALAAGPAPAGITGLTVTGATGVSPRTFTVSGTVDYSVNGTTVTIPVSATDGAGGTATGSFRLVVTPEPASLGLVGLSSLFLGRRRK